MRAYAIRINILALYLYCVNIHLKKNIKRNIWETADSYLTKTCPVSFKRPINIWFLKQNPLRTAALANQHSSFATTWPKKISVKSRPPTTPQKAWRPHGLWSASWQCWGVNWNRRSGVPQLFQQTIGGDREFSNSLVWFIYVGVQDWCVGKHPPWRLWSDSRDKVFLMSFWDSWEVNILWMWER